MSRTARCLCEATVLHRSGGAFGVYSDDGRTRAVRLLDKPVLWTSVRHHTHARGQSGSGWTGYRYIDM